MPHRNLVNMDDVASRAGVSTATVSRALRGLPGVGDGTRERILAIADELSYVISPQASGLARQVTGRVAVVAPRVDLWFYSTMLAGIDQALSAAKLDVLIYQVDGEAQRQQFLRELPARRKVDAVVLMALPVLRKEAERLRLISLRVVVAGGQIGDHPHVRVDDEQVGSTAVEHLIGLGHRRIAMIRTSDTEGTYWSSEAERTRGYQEALASAGIPADPAYLVTVPYGADAGARGMTALMDLPEPPTAVFAFSDEVALGALSHLRSRGLDVPRDISLIGVDGHPQAEVFGLDTIDQSVLDQGRRAGAMVVDLLDERVQEERAERSVLVPTRLVVRGSCGPPPAPARLSPRRSARTAVSR